MRFHNKLLVIALSALLSLSFFLTVKPVHNAPDPGFSASTWVGNPPLAVTFSALEQEDEDLAYLWDIAGLASTTDASVEFTFTSPGFYPVTLTATDSEGTTRQITRVIVVQDPSSERQLPNMILFVGDGMGEEQIRAASLFAYGDRSSLLFESFPHRADLSTYSLSSEPTESAAAATALATGQKVYNHTISVANPGDGRDLYTILELARDLGMSTGMVSTGQITDATPAAFGAHVRHRDEREEIANQLLFETRPNLIFGGGGGGLSPSAALAAGYQVVTNRSEMFALDPTTADYVSGQFGSKNMPYELTWKGDYPHLSEMTAVALDLLDDNPAGFFLLVEGDNIDGAAHIFDLPRVLHEVLELDRSVQVAVEWARSHPNTIILVTADHETGGLVLKDQRGQGNYPLATWTVDGHTSQDVPLYALGVYAHLVSGRLDNTDIPALLTGGHYFNQPESTTAGSGTP